METYTIIYQSYKEKQIKFITKSPNLIHAIGKAYQDSQRGRDKHIFFKLIKVLKEDKQVFPKIKIPKFPTRFVVYKPQSTITYYQQNNQYRKIINQFKPVKIHHNKRISKGEYEKAYYESTI